MKPEQTKPDERLRVEVKSRAELRAWLAKNHARKEAIWLVTWKKGGDAPHLPWPEIVDEALCFGWIDSLPRKLDTARTMVLLSPRRASSGWSAINKKKAEALIAAGRMAPSGLAAIARAKEDGSWIKLDAAHALESPADLAAALAAAAPAAENFAAFSPSSRRGILEWIGAAKKPETRAKRIAETARLAQRNIKANHPDARQAP
jgi:uncharacterized protein YdeI (YjbR/CyaY-like superfamily)